MIVVTVELHSAITGNTTELGTMIIHNVGGTGTRGNYKCHMFKKGDKEKFGAKGLMQKAKPIRNGEVLDHPRLAQPVHSLVAKALASMGY